jgi:hypothetical protein
MGKSCFLMIPGWQQASTRQMIIPVNARNKVTLFLLFSVCGLEEDFATGLLSHIIQKLAFFIFFAALKRGLEIVDHDLDAFALEFGNELLSDFSIKPVIKVSEPVNDIGALINEEFETLMGAPQNRSATT